MIGGERQRLSVQNEEAKEKPRRSLPHGHIPLLVGLPPPHLTSESPGFQGSGP